MLLGVDYYPEQWDESMIDADLDNIVELGSNVIRIAEFAWHLMEKCEGNFDFSFFDKVIEKAKSRDLKVIMGTPTATIPAWLAAKHPDIISEFEDGTKRTFGGRHVFCFNSSHMYSYSEKIVRAMLTHYKDEPQIVAWQIDNEIGHEGSDECYCQNCQTAFRRFLKKKFDGNIDSLNRTYGTAFWSQEYNDFDEIPMPAKTITTHNPALRMDWERFRSQCIVDFIDFQAKLIRQIIPNTTVMHDFPGGGLTKHVDYSVIAESIDKVAYNNYPVWGGQKEPIKPHEIAFELDYIRGLRQENFWITEAIMGAQGHDITGFLPRPEQAKMWSYQGMAHGCDALMYFRYRGAIKGAEQFCYGVIDADNRKRRKFYEVQSFFESIKQYAKALQTPVKSDVAILYNYDSLASFRIQRQSLLLDPIAEMKRLYKVFYQNNISVDIIPSRAKFEQYKIVILPQMIVTTEGFRERIEQFLQNGGTVVMTYRTAVKDTDNNLTIGEMLPVGFGKIAGVTVEETESLQDYNAFPLKGENGYKGSDGYGGIFRDMLVPDTAETLYRYDDKFYKGFSAITKNSYGNGCVYYLGTTPDDETLKKVLESAIDGAKLEKTASPKGVEVVTRGQGENSVKMIINHNDFDVQFEHCTLKPFEVKLQNS